MNDLRLRFQCAWHVLRGLSLAYRVKTVAPFVVGGKQLMLVECQVGAATTDAGTVGAVLADKRAYGYNDGFLQATARAQSRQALGLPI